MRRFVLDGKLAVAEGVVFSDGMVALRWWDEQLRLGIYDNINEMIAIGPVGATRLLFMDD